MSRPYDKAIHRRLRRQIAPQVAAGGVHCWRCLEAGEPEEVSLIEPGTPWDLGHDDDDPDQYRGPEHERCNREAGVRKREAAKAPVESRLGTRSRAW